jgi:hypothetical protein
MQSQQRAASYTPADWGRLRAEVSDIERRLAAVMHRGEPADSEAAVTLAEEHRQHLARWFYDCSHRLHCELGDMYVSDERFTEHYDAVAPGLAVFLRDAIHANTDPADPDLV